MERYHYFDNAATTRVDEEVSGIITKYNSEVFFNPSANYIQSVGVHNEISSARERMLKCLKGYSYKLIYTSSGSESDNTALFCTKKKRNSNIVISNAEHPAIYNTAMQLKALGYEVRLCPVDKSGVVSPFDLVGLVDNDTSLVSVMHVNNETGGANDIKTLVKAVKEKNPSTLFHSDGVQAFGKIPVFLEELGVDLYSISGHKIGAPKGIACLAVKNGVSLAPLIYGGGQESGLRSSTENVSGIMAFAYCAERSVAEVEKNASKYFEFKKVILDSLCMIDDVKVLSEAGSPHIFTFAFKNVRGEVMQHALESDGYCVGTGSACSARRAHERIPKALGLGEYADGVVRISFSRENTLEEVRMLAQKILEHYNILKKYVGK